MQPEQARRNTRPPHPPEDRHLSRLSPGGHRHINFHGKYDFTNPKPLLNGNLRPLNVEPDRYVSSI